MISDRHCTNIILSNRGSDGGRQHWQQRGDSREYPKLSEWGCVGL